MKAAEEGLSWESCSRYLDDDLRWKTPDGRVITKKQRLDRFTKEPRISSYNVVDIQISGVIAIVVADAVFANGRRERHKRTFIEQRGSRQLLRHANVPIK
jgi:hypothetical protein